MPLFKIYKDIKNSYIVTEEMVMLNLLCIINYLNGKVN